MAKPDAEVLLEIFDAVNSEDLERVLALTHPDFEVNVPPELSAEPDVYRGQDGMRRYWESFQDAMEEIRFHADRLWDTGDGVVVALRITARGRQTAIPVEQRMGAIWTIREGSAVCVRVFPSLPDALQAAGVRDERGGRA